MSCHEVLFLTAAAVLALYVVEPCGATLGDSQLLARWSQFKAQFKKNYEPTMDKNRFETWKNNIDLIEKHNAEAEKGMHSFTLGENVYADWSADEYKVLRGFKSSKTSSSRRRRRTNNGYKPGVYIATPHTTIPSIVNWTAQGWVNPVQNQGQCGDCWSFSSCGALEGQYYNVTNTSMILSEQNLLDCSTAQGNDGCNGGNMQNAFNYVRLNSGIDTYSSYPYTTKAGTCRYSSANSAATISGWKDVKANSIPSLQQAVALVGPISVGFDASLPSFQLYKSGVYAPTDCNSQVLDHAMLAVGYVNTSNPAYWIIKNSWGTTWGMQGYIWVAMASNICGVATDASFPVGLQATGVTSSGSGSGSSSGSDDAAMSATGGVSSRPYAMASLYSTICIIIPVAFAARRWAM